MSAVSIGKWESIICRRAEKLLRFYGLPGSLRLSPYSRFEPLDDDSDHDEDDHCHLKPAAKKPKKSD